MSTEVSSVAHAIMPFIDGAHVSSEGETEIEAIDPSTGRRTLSFSEGSNADVDRAVSSARRAFNSGGWSEAAPSVRKTVLARLACLIDRDAAILDHEDAIDMGKPVSLQFGNAAMAAGLIRFHSEAVDKIEGTVYPSDHKSVVIQRRVPRGVVAALVPWNFPTFVTALKIAPALAAGNSVVLKPSELSCRAADHIAALALEAGVPSGVLNVVPGRGDIVGKALGLHMDVDMLTFTGSTTAGKMMLQYSGQSNMKHILAECGGKSPHIVFADVVDLDAVADRIAQGLLNNQGQVCSIGSRLLVERRIEQTLVHNILNRLRDLKVGAASEPQTQFGPLASDQQRNRAMEYIAGGVKDGAQLVIGGQQLLPESGGFFLEPTVLRNVRPESRVAQEEIFGPVLTVSAFDDEGEAVRVANGTRYGLIAYAWTADLSRGMRLMKSIRSTIRINATPPLGEGSGYAASNEPFGQSGVGAEGGMGGMEGYFRRQLVSFSHE